LKARGVAVVRNEESWQGTQAGATAAHGKTVQSIARRASAPPAGPALGCEEAEALPPQRQGGSGSVLVGVAKNAMLRNAAIRIIEEKRREKGVPVQKKGDRFADTVIAAMKRAREEAAKQAEEVRLKLWTSDNDMEGRIEIELLREEFDRVVSEGPVETSGITRDQMAKILMRRCYRRRKDEFHSRKDEFHISKQGSRSPLRFTGAFDYHTATVKRDRNVVSIVVNEAFKGIENRSTMAFDQFVSACSDFERRNKLLTNFSTPKSRRERGLVAKWGDWLSENSAGDLNRLEASEFPRRSSTSSLHRSLSPTSRSGGGRRLSMPALSMVDLPQGDDTKRSGD